MRRGSKCRFLKAEMLWEGFVAVVAAAAVVVVGEEGCQRPEIKRILYIGKEKERENTLREAFLQVTSI